MCKHLVPGLLLQFDGALIIQVHDIFVHQWQPMPYADWPLMTSTQTSKSGDWSSWSDLLRTCHTCSIGLRSGSRVGQFNVLTSFSSFHWLTDRLLLRANYHKVFLSQIFWDYWPVTPIQATHKNCPSLKLYASDANRTGLYSGLSGVLAQKEGVQDQNTPIQDQPRFGPPSLPAASCQCRQ